MNTVNDHHWVKYHWYGGGGGRLCSEFRFESISYRSRSRHWSNEYDVSSLANEHLCFTELYFLFRFHLSKSKSRKSRDVTTHPKMKPSLNRRKNRRKHFFVSIIILTIVVKSRLSTRSREIPKKKPKTPDPSLSIWFWNIILVPLTLVEPSRSKNALPVGRFAFRYRIQFHLSLVPTLE